MAYGVFDEDNDMISGMFTSEIEADCFRSLYVEDDGYDSLFTDKVCDKHSIDQPESKCQCWDEMPYEDERGFFGPGTGATSARI